jgi:hypothetical protein
MKKIHKIENKLLFFKDMIKKMEGEVVGSENLPIIIGEDEKGNIVVKDLTKLKKHFDCRGYLFRKIKFPSTHICYSYKIKKFRRIANTIHRYEDGCSFSLP